MPGRRAAPALCAAVALAACVCACGLDRERDVPPSLVLSPSTALQGAFQTVLLTAPGVPLSMCQDLGATSLEFSFGDAPSQIETTTLETLDEDTLRARLLVSMDAAPGDHLVALHCDAQTELTGIFKVRERLEDAAITTDPTEVKAGSVYFKIDIFGQDIAFDQDSSHVVFGDGTEITVGDSVIVDATSQMSVWVDVDPLTPEGPMEVAVVTGDLVARGEIEILPRDTPWILVEPDYVELTGTSTPAQTTLTITGNSVAFVEPDPEADAGAVEDVTVVAFPENPGLHVTSMSVDDLNSSLMTVNVLADQGAILGSTPLAVTTGGETVSAAFMVYPPGGAAAFLTLSPSYLPRGARASAVVVRGHFTAPFTDEDPYPGGVYLDEDACHLEKLERLSGSELAVDLSVDADFTGDACTLHVETAAASLVAKLAVVTPLEPVLSGFTSIAQGAGYVWIEVHSTEVDGVDPVVFDADTVATAGPRSGVDIFNQVPGDDGKTLAVMIRKVAGDAPIGEAKLHVLDDGVDYLVDYSVIPSEETPTNVLVSPGTVIGGRREVSLELDSVDPSGGSTTDAMSFDAGALPQIEFDNPAIRATSVDVLGAHQAVVTATVLPAVAADTAVMYVTSGDRKAAASLRILPAQEDVAIAVDPEITRGAAGEIAFVEAEVRAGAFQPAAVVGEVFADLGVDVLGVDLYPGGATPGHKDDLYLQLQVAPDGPAGWFGVVLTDGRRKVVLPLHIGGDVDSLTMTVAPESVDGAVHPGDTGIIVDALLPYAAPEDDGLAEARGAVNGVFATLDALAGSTASLTVDVADDVEPMPDGIPIAVLAGKGAAVGFVPIVETAPVELSETVPMLDVYLDPVTNPVARVDAVPTSSFSYAVVSAAQPDRADATLSLLAADGLSVQGVSERGILWFMEGGAVEPLRVTPVGETGDLPSSLRLASYGAGIGYAAEDELPIALDDPCAAPVLVAASIGAPLDEDAFEVSSGSTCDLVAAVIARAVGDRPWDTPDTMLELLDDIGDATPFAKSLGWPSAATADPRLYFSIDPAQARFLVVAPELGSAGSYLLHVRRDAVIREICGGDGSAPAFIELDLRPGADLSAFAVRLVDPGSLLYVELPLSGAVPADGIVVIGDAGEGDPDILDTAGVTDFTAGTPYAVQLVESSGVVDAVQVDGTPGAGEGDPLSSAEGPRCFARPAFIDTNDNDLDFVGSWLPTPGE